MTGTSRQVKPIKESRVNAVNPMLWPLLNGSWRMPTETFKKVVGLVGSLAVKREEVSEHILQCLFEWLVLITYSNSRQTGWYHGYKTLVPIGMRVYFCIKI